jgi:drug/metabolite transporter (DMT)-like permease
MNIGGFVIAALFIVLAVIFLMGKGDKLIAGYNTLSEEERKGINIHRLRVLMAIVSVLTACFCILLSFIGEDRNQALIAGFVFILITIIIVILANTWAKKK